MQPHIAQAATGGTWEVKLVGIPPQAVGDCKCGVSLKMPLYKSRFRNCSRYFAQNCWEVFFFRMTKCCNFGFRAEIQEGDFMRMGNSITILSFSFFSCIALGVFAVHVRFDVCFLLQIPLPNKNDKRIQFKIQVCFQQKRDSESTILFRALFLVIF